jgi:hypothetical protein
MIENPEDGDKAERRRTEGEKRYLAGLAVQIRGFSRWQNTTDRFMSVGV